MEVREDFSEAWSWSFDIMEDIVVLTRSWREVREVSPGLVAGRENEWWANERRAKRTVLDEVSWLSNVRHVMYLFNYEQYRVACRRCLSY